MYLYNNIKYVYLYRHSLYSLANIVFQQHKRQLYTWTSPDGQYENKHIFGDHYLPLLKAWHVSGIVLSTLHELTVLRGSYYLFLSC